LASLLTICGTHDVHRRPLGCRGEPLVRPSLQSLTGSSIPRDCHPRGTASSARPADQLPAEVAGWNHPIRVTTVHPAGSRVSTTGHPAVKVENVADDDSQREVEGGDHRLLLQPDHRGQPPPVDPAAQDRGRRQDLPGRVVLRRRPSPQGLRPGRGRRRRAQPIRGPPPRPEAASSSSTRPHPGHRGRVPVHRRGDGARRRAEPPARPGGAPPGRDWPLGLSSGRCERRPARTRLGGP
jgi:hypothetical protein